MTHSGVLSIEFGETRLSGTLLAVHGGNPNPLSAATNLVRGTGLDTGDRAVASGEPGSLGGASVFFMTSIVAAAVPAALRAALPRFELAAAEVLPDSVPADLDPRLQWWIARRQAGQRKAATSSTETDEIAVVARVTDPDAWAALSEVRVPTTIGPAVGSDGLADSAAGIIVTGRIPVLRIAAVRQQPFVKSLKAARDLRPQLSATTQEIGARPELMPSGHLANGGDGVVVGIIDYGGDFAHENFRRADGTTRLLTLWDQDGTTSALSPFGYGREHSADRINMALQQPNPYAALKYDPTMFDDDADPGSHGTHVMDIAAGSGRGTGVPGVAPAADLVFVNISHAVDPEGTAVIGKSFGDSVRLLEAAKYIFERAGQQPCVVNISLGTNGGPHDGSTLVEQGLDALIAERPNRAIVIAAANAFADGIHASGAVPQGGTVELKWRLPNVPLLDVELEIWYRATDRFTAELLDPSGAVRATVRPGENKTLLFGNRTVFASNRLTDPNNGDNMIGVFLSQGIAPGTYTVRLRGDVVSDGSFHAWIERDNTFASHFLPPHDNSHTIGSISCGRLSVAVGSYDAHKEARPVSFFSSAGPTRDGRNRPEVSAPGHAVRAALSGSGTGTRLMSGTSMAAPAVTGVVALMLAEARRRGVSLSAQDVLQIVTRTSRRKPPSGTKWHPQYGTGRVDAAAAVQAVIDGVPGGTPPAPAKARRRRGTNARSNKGSRNKPERDMARGSNSPRKKAFTARADPEDATPVEVIVKVREANYVPPGVTVRAQISPQLFTSVIQGSVLKKLQQDPGVHSISVSQTLRTNRS